MENTKKQTLIQAIKFTLFSISAGAIQFGSTALFIEVLFFKYWVGYLLGLILSILWNYTLNRKFTFKSSNNIPIAMIKVAVFYAFFTPVSTILGDYFVKVRGVNDLIVLAITMLANFVLEFLYTKFFVYGRETPLTTASPSKIDPE